MVTWRKGSRSCFFEIKPITALRSEVLRRQQFQVKQGDGDEEHQEHKVSEPAAEGTAASKEEKHGKAEDDKKEDEGDHPAEEEDGEEVSKNEDLSVKGKGKGKSKPRAKTAAKAKAKAKSKARAKAKATAKAKGKPQSRKARTKADAVAESVAKKAAAAEDQAAPVSAGSEIDGEHKDVKENEVPGDKEPDQVEPKEEPVKKVPRRKSKGDGVDTEEVETKEPTPKRTSEDAKQEDKKPRKRTKGATPETFARRRCPTTVIGEHKFHAIRSVFTDDIKPLLTKYSHHEELGFQNLQVWVAKFPVLTSSHGYQENMEEYPETNLHSTYSLKSTCFKIDFGQTK